MVQAQIQALSDRLTRLEDRDDRILRELGDITRRLAEMQGATLALTNHVLGQKEPEDSTSTEVGNLRRSIAPARHRLVKKLQSESDAGNIERDLEGFERTIFRSFAFWRSIIKRSTIPLAAIAALGHLSWQIYLQIQHHFH